jgi:hypothetical protein
MMTPARSDDEDAIISSAGSVYSGAADFDFGDFDFEGSAVTAGLTMPAL